MGVRPTLLDTLLSIKSHSNTYVKVANAMNTESLPSRLLKEPLIDAVFELRFSSTEPASNILPGALFAQLGGVANSVSVQKLPLSQLPEALRRADPNLQFSPLVKIDWERFMVLVSDGSVAVACKLPYPGWKAFNDAIARVVIEVSKVGIVKTIDRFSLKYVDLVPASDLKKQVNGINWLLKVGNHKLDAEIASVRIEIPRGDFRHIVSLQTGAVSEVPDRPRTEGVIVDVDTIRKLPMLDIAVFLEQMPKMLNAIHAENKQMFFECLTQETIKSLEPVYE